MKIFILRCLTWLAIHCWYYVFSKNYQLTIERRYLKAVLPSYNSIVELTGTVGRMRWRRDGYMELWDAISNPKATWSKHKLGLKAGDCDDISLFAADRIEDMMKRGKLPDVVEVGLLSVPWDDGFKVGGHNVCVFRYRETDHTSSLRDIHGRPFVYKWAHMSNWDRGEPREDFDSLEAVVRNVLGRKKSIGWALATVKLKRKKYGWGSKI